MAPSAVLRLAAIPAIAGAAFLVFLVQPLLGKYLLPWFGGAPATWNACLLFFQAALLAGYAYAYASLRWLPPRAQAWTHIALLAAAAATLPIVPAAPPDAAAEARPATTVLLLLAGAVGAPYVALAATAPLVQAWLARGGGAPWRWYALSNLASFAALIGYPLAIEPWLGRGAQCAWWSAGFVAVAVAIALCAWTAPRPSAVDAPAAAGPAPSWRRCAAWLLLPALATVLLAATSNLLCLDVASVPFLWVLPLALYLLSFVLAFAGGRWYPRAIVLPLAALALVAGARVLIDARELVPRIAVLAGVLFTCCWALHGELVRLRPAPARLAGFYLAIALGGAVGGALVALVAPVVFPWFIEFHLGLFACALAIAGVLLGDADGWLRRRRWTWPALAGGLLVLAALLGWALHVHLGKAVVSRRNFHGVLQVRDYRNPRDGVLRKLQHGTTVHGVQLMEPARRGEPTAYYGPDSGIGRCLRLTARPEGRRIGVIGLGIGTLAVWAGPRDRVRFYEINPAAVELARTCFTVLADRRQQIEAVVVGDGRLALAREPAQGFDVLVMDAFSGDAVPAHLITREALAVYRRHLRPDGVIAVNISNRHLDLRPLVFNLAEDAGLHALLLRDRPGKDAPAQRLGSDWMLLSADLALFEHEEIVDAASRDYGDTAGVGVWTDERSDLFRLLK